MIFYPPTLSSSLTWQHFDIIDSTNNYLLAADQPVNQLVSAERQTQGRGRRKKQWIDGGKSLLFSLSTTFNPQLDVSAWPVQVAMILTQVLTPLTPFPIQIKWPNDLYILDAQQQWGKCAGILIESSIGKQTKMVTGVGLNLAPIKNIDTDYPVGHITTSVDKDLLLILLANELFTGWKNFLLNPLVNPNKFIAMDYLRSKTFSAIDAHTQQTHHGIGIGINTQGHYQLQQGQQTIVLSSQQHIRDIV